MAVYESDPNRYGINFLGNNLGQGASGLVSGILQRQDPRNIEIRRTWGDPYKHMTPFGWAPETPSAVTSDFDIVGGFIPTTDASGKPLLNPATGQPVLKWDQHPQPKGSPIPPGYKILSNPYSQFPSVPAKKELPWLGIPGMPSVISPLRMESGGEVPNNNPLQAIVTLLAMEHSKSNKGEVPAILHKGEGVVTKKGMKVLNGIVGGIDNLNSLGETLPRMAKGGEVGKNKSDKKEVSWELMTDESGKKVWVQTTGKEGQTYPWEPYLPKQHTSGETYFLPWDPVNRQPQQYTQNPEYTPQPFMGWEAVNPYGGINPPTTTTNQPIDAIAGKEVVERLLLEKVLNRPVESPPQKHPQKPPLKPTETTNKMAPIIPSQPGYRDWNAPLQFSFGQLQGMNPLQALGIIQADVESRGIPPLQPVYGAQGQVLPQQSIADQRMAMQGEIVNQYLGGLQGEATKIQTDWYPKEAKARIDQINSQIAYNNTILKAGAIGGLAPDDMLKLAQVEKINSELSNSKVAALEEALKLSDKMSSKSKQLLMLEYLMTKYPELTGVSYKDLMSYLGKINLLGPSGITILGIPFGKPDITPEDVAIVSNKVSGAVPITVGTSDKNLNKVQNEYQTTSQNPTIPTAPGTLTNQLLNMQNKLISTGAIK